MLECGKVSHRTCCHSAFKWILGLRVWVGVGVGCLPGCVWETEKGREREWLRLLLLLELFYVYNFFFFVHPINFTNSRHWKRQLNPVLSNPVTTLRVSVNSCWSLISIWSCFEGEEQVHLNWLKLASSRMLFGTSGTAWTVSAESAAGTIHLQRKDPVTSENSYNFPPSRQPCQEKIL